MKIPSWIAFLIYTAVMAWGYVMAIVYPAAPFLAFATQFTIGLGLYLGKRLVQKKKGFNGHD